MKTTTSKQRVTVGLSGGVDSTAAALLLKEKGYEVIGVYIDVTGEDSKGRGEALKVAEKLGIALSFADVSKEFSKVVIADFGGEYMKGRTPNPCVICNPLIKFKSLLNAAEEHGASFIATGHYANVIYDESEGCYFIKKAGNEKKDQSYMLYRLGRDALSRLILPLGRFKTKDEVRGYVGENCIGNADARDSQEICFLPDGVNYVDYLKSLNYSTGEGEFVDSDYKVIGRHKGIVNYTVGQRKNLGMSFGRPMFVVKIDSEKNRVVLGNSEELFSREVISKHNFFTKSGSGEMPEEYDRIIVAAKARYASDVSEAVIKRIDSDTVKTVFKKPQRAVTPGQSIVFYDGDKVIGGGIISKTL